MFAFLFGNKRSDLQVLLSISDQEIRLFRRFLPRTKDLLSEQGTQHITGTVSNEATSDMGYLA